MSEPQEAQEIKCDKCGHVMQIGEHPFCPHGSISTMFIHDEIAGGLVLENYGPHPIKVYSHSERRRIMKERGLQEIEKFCPMPGTDIDPQGIPNPAGFMDPQTLENARVLISRNGQGSGVDPADDVKFQPINAVGDKYDAMEFQAAIATEPRRR